MHKLNPNGWDQGRVVKTINELIDKVSALSCSTSTSSVSDSVKTEVSPTAKPEAKEAPPKKSSSKRDRGK